MAPRLARGGPPFVTDDPEPVPLHHWELYMASRLEHETGGTTATLPEIEVNYGAIENLQLHVILPFVLNAPDDGDTEYGYGDTELGFKYRFIQETEKTPMVAIFPLVQLPTGDTDKGLGNGKAQYFLPIWIQKSWDEWTTYGGAGYVINNASGAKDHWLIGWELQRKMNEHVILGGEIFHQTSDEEGADGHTAFNLGGFYNLNENHHILFSFGRDIDGDTEFRSYVAYQFTI
jgi:hypothetical protein